MEVVNVLSRADRYGPVLGLRVILGFRAFGCPTDNEVDSR